jgi:hypothetical protein
MEGLAASVLLIAILLGVLLVVAFDVFCLLHLGKADTAHFLPKFRLGRSHRVYQPSRGPRLPARATPAEAITGAAHEASESRDWGCMGHPGPARHRAMGGD